MRQKKLYLRAGNENDVDLLFRWANDKEVRQNAFHTEMISYADHLKWFKTHIESDGEIFYILMESDEAVGQARLSVCKDEAGIDYSIVAGKRGQGYGSELLRLMIEKIREEHPEIKRLTAKVKPENTASARCFAGGGFSETYRQYELELE